jgi:hypothetical protein
VGERHGSGAQFLVRFEVDACGRVLEHRRIEASAPKELVPADARSLDGQSAVMSVPPARRQKRMQSSSPAPRSNPSA